jgi:hypothetical protein
MGGDETTKDNILLSLFGSQKKSTESKRDKYAAAEVDDIRLI